jgi:hypothetical protein
MEYFCCILKDIPGLPQRPYNGIPPSRAALVEHIKRSVLQAGHTWGQSLCMSPTLPSPSRWGWEIDSGVWVPHWTSFKVSFHIYVHCTCAKIQAVVVS